MSLRYIGGVISPSVNPLAANVTTSPNVAQYNGVFSLQQQSQALTSGQWATDPYYKNTTLLLHADGKANGSQNNTFLDSGPSALSIIRNGNTTQGSFSPYGTNWANYFNGASSLSLATATALGTGNTTVEFWFYPTDSSATYRTICDGRSSNGTDTGYAIFQYGLTIEVYGAVLKVSTAANAFSVNTWVHIALVRTSGTCQLYVNGIASGSSASYSSNLTSTKRIIGDHVSASLPFLGYISNYREVTSALYSGTFTPSTTPLTAISGTALLTCQSNRFVDNSTNSYAITANGTPSVQRFSPFTPQYQYTPAVIGGSSYFDGSGDYLQIPMVDIRSSTCTLEFWVYIPTGSVAYTIFNNWNSGASVSTSSFTIDYDGAGFQIYSVRPGVSYWDAGPGFSFNKAASPGQWHHVALTSDGSSSKFFVNGELVGTGAYPLGGVNSTYYTIGANTYYASGYFKGYVAGVRVLLGTQLYTAAFTPPTSPPTSITNTQFLLNYTNAGIYDNAMMNDLETVGNAQVIAGFSKYGSGSLKFDGTGDGLICAASPQMTFGTGDLTIEFWMYTASSSANYDFIDLRGSAGTGTAYCIYQSGGTIRVIISNGGDVITSPSPSASTWHHIALTRLNGSLKLFVDGTQVGSTFSDSNNYATQYPCYIGYAPFGGYDLNGYIDDLRITKGVARYTGNFIPPKVAFANQ